MSSPVCTILKREWKAYFNSPVAYVFIVIFLALAGFFTFNVSRFYEAGQASLDRFFFWHPWIYLILVPAVAMRLWAEERRTGTLELLLTFPVTTAQAIAGKFLAAWLFVLLALALTFPVVATAFYLGSPDPGPIITGYIGSALLAGAYLAVGSLTSALTRNQVISFIIAAVIGLFLLLAGFPPVTDFLYQVAPAWVVETVAGFSFSAHFEQMQRGVLDLRDILYFASAMAFMLLATHVTLDNRRTK
ncbi:MAG: ABC transporter permease [Kiritimatiellae bacterium]|nr:ABC transporter permease [Kiritimatiellia bacterium]MCO5044430.1 ABC transporter permease [Kiritimatiellia bacterium]MCO5062126.1 ABC transporter permease [Kiritimatiellia bacterium]MCO5068447.1 ABC transporter permease [Kiritimatiellia bacterium]MCO6401045.1 ABC transporter permease [Verrucomicrobiota bacterium]